MKTYSLFTLLCLALCLCFSSCSQKETSRDFEITTLYPEKRFSGFSEEHFLGYISSLDVHKDRLYLCSYKQNLIYVSDLDYNLIKVYDKNGKGPEDINYPRVCYANDDGLYLIDRMRLSRFSRDGEFQQTYELESYLKPVHGFVVDGDILTGSGYNSMDIEPGFNVNLNGALKSRFGHHDMLVKEVNPGIANTYHIEKWKNLIVVACLTDPVIELYKSDSLTHQHRYDDIEIFQDFIQRKIRRNRESGQRGRTLYFFDADMSENFLYLLVGNYDEKTGLNNPNLLLEFEVKKESIYRRRMINLSSRDSIQSSYSRIAVSREKIYAYDSRQDELHEFSMK